MKKTEICWLSVLAVIVSLPAVAMEQRGSSRLADLPTAAQPAISAALGQDLAQYHVRKATNGLRAENPEQRLSLHFANNGVEVQHGGGQWQIVVSGFGYDGALQPAQTAEAVEAGTNRIEYRHGSLTEWYVNGPLGLEQGFTLDQAPSKKSDAPLTIAMALSAGLTATLDKDLAGVTINEADLRYSGLKARDANGKELHAWMDLRDDQVLLRVDDAGARYPVVVDPFVQAGKLTSSDGVKDDQFGTSVSVSTSGTTIAVGVPYATVNNQNYAGAAYVFTEPTDGWGTMTQSAKLVPAGTSMLFGYSVAVDGNTVAVGAPGNTGSQGAVYVYVEPNGGWSGTLTQSAKLTASKPVMLYALGRSVAVTVDPNTGLGTVAAGSPGYNYINAPSLGAVYVFVEPSGGWVPGTQTALLTNPNGKTGDALGSSVAISSNAVAAGAFSAAGEQGEADVFVEPSGGWSQWTTSSPPSAILTASDGQATDDFGWSISLSNRTIAVGAPYHSGGGAAYVFVQPAGGWKTMTQTAEVSAGLTSGQFGTSVATDGATVVAGAPMVQNGSQNGAVYGFFEPASGWTNSTTPSFTLTASDEGNYDEFGYAVAVNADVMAAGSPYATVNSNLFQGAAYVFSSGVTGDGVVVCASGNGCAGTGQPPSRDVDPQGAIGTKQFFEWTNANNTQGGLQAFDKVTMQPLWGGYPYQYVDLPWALNSTKGCESVGGDGQIIFDSQAQNTSGTTGVWVIGAHNSPGVTGPYYYCIAVSSSDDLTNATEAGYWYTYAIPLDSYLGTYSCSQGTCPNFPDWPKLSTWWNAYYVTLDVLYPPDIDNHVHIGSYMPLGVLVCALDRTNMILGKTPNPAQCFTDPSPIPQNPTTSNLYLKHSVIPADIDGSTPPPANRDEFMLSIQNPPFDLKTTTSTALTLWDFHLDWSNSKNSSLTHAALTVPTYTPGCYQVGHPLFTFCVKQPTSATSLTDLDSVGDRLMPRLAYRNFGSYESFVITHTVDVNYGKSNQTGLRWYELRDSGSGSPTLYQSGTISYDKTSWRHVPSIDEDQTGNAAIGYSLTSTTVHPSIYASSWSLTSTPKPTEFPLWGGSGDLENEPRKGGPWGSYTGMTVDPVDGCTFWYVNEYLTSDQTDLTQTYWSTRISNFKLPTCH